MIEWMLAFVLLVVVIVTDIMMYVLLQSRIDKLFIEQSDESVRLRGEIKALVDDVANFMDKREFEDAKNNLEGALNEMKENMNAFETRLTEESSKKETLERQSEEKIRKSAESLKKLEEKILAQMKKIRERMKKFKMKPANRKKGKRGKGKKNPGRGRISLGREINETEHKEEGRTKWTKRKKGKGTKFKMETDGGVELKPGRKTKRRKAKAVPAGKEAETEMPMA
jgi:hypothetical protein